MAERREKDTLLRSGIAGPVVAATGYALWRRRGAARGGAGRIGFSHGLDDGDG